MENKEFKYTNLPQYFYDRIRKKYNVSYDQIFSAFVRIVNYLSSDTCDSAFISLYPALVSIYGDNVGDVDRIWDEKSYVNGDSPLKNVLIRNINGSVFDKLILFELGYINSSELFKDNVRKRLGDGIIKGEYQAYSGEDMLPNYHGTVIDELAPNSSIKKPENLAVSSDMNKDDSPNEIINDLFFKDPALWMIKKLNKDKTSIFSFFDLSNDSDVEKVREVSKLHFDTLKKVLFLKYQTYYNFMNKVFGDSWEDRVYPYSNDELSIINKNYNSLSSFEKNRLSYIKGNIRSKKGICEIFREIDLNVEEDKGDDLSDDKYEDIQMSNYSMFAILHLYNGSDNLKFASSDIGKIFGISYDDVIRLVSNSYKLQIDSSGSRNCKARRLVKND